MSKQKDFAALLELLNSLDHRDRGYTGTRLSGIVSGNADEPEFRRSLCALAAKADAFELVDEAYSTAIGLTDADQYLGRLIALKYSKAMLAWLCGKTTQVQDRSLEIWTDIITTTVPDDVDNRPYIEQMRANAAIELPKALLQRLKDAGPGSPLTEPYAGQLATTTKITPSVEFSENKSTALTLGRYYRLAGDENRAKSVLSDRVRKIFQTWSPDEAAESWSSHLRLAHTFTALDDDVNALAAWRLLAPRLSPAKAGETLDAKQDASKSNDNDNQIIDQGGWEDEDSNEEEQQATSGAEDDEESSVTASSEDKASGEESSTHEDDQSEESEDEEGAESTDEVDNGAEDPEKVVPGQLRGWLHSFCDGCGESWTYVDNIYCCKDCLDVQLEPNCYAALKAGKLDPEVCSSKHEFLHIPPFDEQEWRSLAERDMVKVGDATISRIEWLKGIKEQWGIDTQSFEKEAQLGSAVKLIERLWKIVRSKRRQRA